MESSKDISVLVSKWVEDSILSILITPNGLSGLVHERCKGFIKADYSISDFVENSTKTILKAFEERKFFNDDEYDDDLDLYELVQNIFPVLRSIKDNTGILEKFVDPLIKILYYKKSL
jgi:hypothetical protein